jgi:hypothetical protein
MGLLPEVWCLGVRLRGPDGRNDLVTNTDSASVLAKLGLRDRHQAVVFAFENRVAGG